MPEGVEVTWATYYLNKKFSGMYLKKMIVHQGRYTRNDIVGSEFVKKKLKLCRVYSKGKLLIWEWRQSKKKDKYYMLNTLGLTGRWSYNSGNVEFIFCKDRKNSKETISIYFDDIRNFGTIKFINSEEIESVDNLRNKDLVKESFDYKYIKDIFENNKTIAKKPIVKVLMEQGSLGIGSGIGNYLVAEILYKAKISPHRITKTLTLKEIKKLTKSIKYIIKLSYLKGQVGYFDNLDKKILKTIQRTRKKIINGKLPELDYHPEIKISEKSQFYFKAYRQSEDPKGNEVVGSKIIKGRTTYWVPAIQK
jgi:formamidopyrimidine-DNA glycosylase